MILTSEQVKKIVVAPETLGGSLRLCAVYPRYRYERNVKTNDLVGYTYVVTCSGLNGDKLGIVIPGEQLLGVDEYDRRVQFEGLRIGIYPSYENGEPGIKAIGIKASATGVSVVDD